MYNVELLVQRNRFAPEFLNSPYTLTVDRSTIVNSNIGQVFIQDRDTVYPFNVWRISTTGDASAPTLFGVRDNGTIYVRNSLTSASIDEYL